MTSLLFPDDVVLVTSHEGLQPSLEQFKAEGEAIGKFISTFKSESVVLLWSGPS